MEASSQINTHTVIPGTDDDTRVTGYDPLLQPLLLRLDFPLSQKSRQTIALGRQLCTSIVHGEDSRVIVVVGPCSIHSPSQALEYATLLQDKVASGAWPGLVIVMRSYFEKPRTTVGWKGLINDPDIDGTYKINKGLKTARELLCSITEKGLPVACELLDTISPQYLADTISFGAIGARTTESQLHRELASGCSFPIGFKNGTDGGITVAIDAIRSASQPHAFMGINSHGLASIVRTSGNTSAHIILRGGGGRTNFDAESVRKAADAMKAAKLKESIMIDCSHGNAQKDHRNQPKVLKDIARQLREGEKAITGVMIESFLEEGKQSVPEEGPQALKYGVSITDACVNWPQTIEMLDDLNSAVLERNSKFDIHGKAATSGVAKGVNGTQ